MDPRCLLGAPAALVLSTLMACGGPERMQPPPADTTTTTSAPAQAGESKPSDQENPAALPPAKYESSPRTTDSPYAPSAAQTTLTNATMASNAPADSSGAMTDGRIVAAIQEASREVLAQSRLAVKNARSEKTRELATHLLGTIGTEEAKLDGLVARIGIPRQEGPASDEVRARGDRIVLHLKSANGFAFDRAFAEGEVDELQKLIDLVDRSEMQAKSEDLKAFLRGFREPVSESERYAVDARASVQR